LGIIFNMAELSDLEKFYKLVCETFTNEPKVRLLASAKNVAEIWEQLILMLKLSPAEVAAKLATQCGMIAVKDVELDYKAMASFSAEFIHRYGIAPIDLVDNELHIAVSNPFDQEMIQGIRFIVNRSFDLRLCSPVQIDEALHRFYSNSKHHDSSQGVIVIKEGHPAGSSEHAIVGLAEKLLTNSVKANASDLHIQPYLGGGEVRHRIDGMLRRVALLPNSVYEKLCRYFKASSNMDPSNERIPQDGRLSLTLNSLEFELRISTLPSKGGERLVIRFLGQNQKFSLSRSGISIAEIQKLRHLAVYPSGIILVTGPTGSGKTSTLYSLLGEIDSPDKNIITIENPVEHTIPTISQVEVNEKAGLTFANALRTVLRQDPDIILLGEIRDSETAKIATQAALTGHLVFSTVHTNNAVSAITRLTDLGIKETVIADSLIGVISQRLCRSLCPHCKIPNKNSLLPEEEAFKSITLIEPAYRKHGCEKCDFTGYLGRFPITEILEINSPSDREAIVSGDIHRIKNLNNKLNNFQSISSSAARHIISGNTTVEETIRIIGQSFWKDLAIEYQKPEPEFVTTLGSQLADIKQDAILILAEPERATELSSMLEGNWFDVVVVSSSAEAKKVMQLRSEIIFAIVDVPEHLAQAEIIEFIHQGRIDMAWTRLPAVILLPEDKEALESILIDDGATSPCLVKPVTSLTLQKAVRNALSSEQPKTRSMEV